MSVKKILPLVIIGILGFSFQASAIHRRASIFDNVMFDYLISTVGTSKQMEVGGKKIDFLEYYSKPVDNLFNDIGQPDYQSGWIGYCEYSGTSFYSRMFTADYRLCELPIKTYLWKMDQGYFMCMCTYSDEERALSFPLSYKWDFDSIKGRFTYWFSRHSDEKGFCVLFWKWVDYIEQVELYTFIDKPDWRPLGEREVCSLYDYYVSDFRVGASSGCDCLKSFIGKDRDMFLTGTKLWGQSSPRNSVVYCKWFLPRSLKEETVIIKDKLPIFFRVDEYNSFPNEYYHVFYNMRDSLIFITTDRYERMVIEL